jgi:2-keto-4-pentenoate hydratase/2-oxohepta-3-ene-1,7-dioic acid hydratase in catechol pathway
MKIIGIGANYKEANREYEKYPEELMIFSKPETSLASGKTFHFPKYCKEVHYEMEIVLEINKKLKDVTVDQAHGSFSRFCLGMDWTAKDLQRKAKEMGWPWTFAKGFDEAAFLGEWIEVTDVEDVHSLDLEFRVNGQTRLKGNTANLIASYEYIISYTSRFMTLLPGDLIMTGTPPKQGPIHVGDFCEGFIGDKKYLEFEVL